MIEMFKQWWCPREYHVEYFKGMLGMGGYHDKKRFTSLRKAKYRLKELADMNQEEVITELGFQPTFLRILEVRTPK